MERDALGAEVAEWQVVAGLAGKVAERLQVVGHGLGGVRVGRLELDELARPGVVSRVGDQGLTEAVIEDRVEEDLAAPSVDQFRQVLARYQEPPRGSAP